MSKACKLEINEGVCGLGSERSTCKDQRCKTVPYERYGNSCSNTNKYGVCTLHNLQCNFPMCQKDKPTEGEPVVTMVRKIHDRQNTLMKYDPSNREENPYPSFAAHYRSYHGGIAWLFNPWTGEMRDPKDIGSDVTGLLID